MINYFNILGNKITGLFGNKWPSVTYSRMLGQQGPVWMNVEKPGEVYRTIPQIQSVIDKKAKMFSNMEIKIMKGDEEVDIPELKKLLENPNQLCGMNDWLEEYKVQEQVYGNQFMYKNKPARVTDYPKSLMNISAVYIQPVLTGKYFDQVDMKGIVKNYEYRDDSGTFRLFETETILHSRIKDLDNPLIGCPPIMSLKFPVTNTKLAYEYYNVISGEKGAIGILSNKGKDAMGSTPLTPEQSKLLHDTYISQNGIGEGQKRVMITDATIDWQPMSYPTRELMLQEQIDANFITIVNRFGLNINMFINSTYENVRHSIIQSYQDTIIPEADRMMQRLTKFLLVPEGVRLVASYDHLAILQNDKQKEAQTIDQQIKAIMQLVDKNIVSREQASEIITNLTHIDLGPVPVMQAPTTTTMI